MDAMFSVDLMVPDTVHTAHLLADRLGIPPLRSTWHDEGRTLDDYLYMRASHPLSQSTPTLIEILNPGVYDTIRPAAVGRQAEGRPMVTHATVLITKEYDAMIERMRAAGVRHYEMPDPGDGLARCWFGVEDLDPENAEANDYDPDSDGGLFLEVISWEGTALAQRGPLPVQPGDGGIERIQARTYLVDDIDATLASMRRSLAWPADEVEIGETDDVRYLLAQPALATSAALELVQPTSGAGRHGTFHAEWGSGPHAIRMEVGDLGVKAADLEARGTPFGTDEAPDGRPVLLVDPAALEGIVVEFAEPISTG